MNSTCQEAYNIFCQHNRGTQYESVKSLLDFMKIYKKKTDISITEYELLGLYSYHCVGKIDLTNYEVKLLLQALGELTIKYSPSNSQNISFIFHSITRKL
mgnify:CR=1 FL=1